jgi:hypothetical protein
MFEHLPAVVADRVADHATALDAAVRTGTRIGSGLGTSEPSRFCASLWEHIRAKDLRDIEIRQALFNGAPPVAGRRRDR